MKTIFSHNGKVIGHIKDRTFYKRVNSLKGHFCWKHKGWGIDYHALQNQIKPDADLIRILDESDGKIYQTTVEKFNHGIVDTLRKSDGVQVFLPSSEFDLTLPDTKQEKLL